MLATTRHPHWHGMLSAETRDDIAARMQEVLGGHYFTVVICNSYSEDSERFSAVEVYPSQRLTGPVEPYRDPSLAGISWLIDRLSMGVHTTARTAAEARLGKPHKYAHFTFEPGRIEIDHYAPAGYRLRWIFAIERHDAEDES